MILLKRPNAIAIAVSEETKGVNKAFDARSANGSGNCHSTRLGDLYKRLAREYRGFLLGILPMLVIE
jgi:hypothetical protein